MEVQKRTLYKHAPNWPGLGLTLVAIAWLLNWSPTLQLALSPRGMSDDFLSYSVLTGSYRWGGNRVLFCKQAGRRLLNDGLAGNLDVVS